MSWLFRIRQVCIVLVVIYCIHILFQSYSTTTTTKSTFNVDVEDGSRNFKIIVVHGDDDRDKTNRTSTIERAMKEQSCKIPHLDINGSDVRDFFEYRAPANCSKYPQNWVSILENGTVQFAESRKGAECKIVYYTRKNDANNNMFPKESIKDGEKMKQDFGVVDCHLNGETWSGLLMSVVRSESVIQRSKLKTPAPNALNVFWLGFDSVSHMTFLRKLPKTVKVLEETLDTVILNGYNIVGDGTPQAFIPMLTAQTEEELPLTRKRFKNAHYVDDVYPFVWKNFSDAGYATAYGEDAFNIGTFTYRLKGFRNQPTDHYTRTFFKEYEKRFWASNTDGWVCMGSEPLFKHWFHYARQFMTTYAELPRFLLMHQSLISHDDINIVQVQDDFFSQFLLKMHSDGLFENSVVIVMADHGHRFAKLRNTHQGQLEERLPFFSIALPKSFTSTVVGQKAHQNLKDNSMKLTTPFDIHATLLDILRVPSESDIVKMQDTENSRSLSLLRPIPTTRTCSQAGVEVHWCTCLAWQNATSKKEDIATSQMLAQAVVDTINVQLKDVLHLCAPLKLAKLISASKLIPNKELLAYKNVKDADGFVPDLTGSAQSSFAHYQLKFQTTPGVAIYEVTLFYDWSAHELHVDLDSISHVNKYGNAPHCIISKNYYLATYCVCHDQV